MALFDSIMGGLMAGKPGAPTAAAPQQQPQQPGGLNMVRPSLEMNEDVRSSLEDRLLGRYFGEADVEGSLAQLKKERDDRLRKLADQMAGYEPVSAAESFLTLGSALKQRVRRDGGSPFSQSISNAAQAMAPLAEKESRLKQEYKTKATQLLAEQATKDYEDALKRSGEMSKMLLENQYRTAKAGANRYTFKVGPGGMYRIDNSTGESTLVDQNTFKQARLSAEQRVRDRYNNQRTMDAYVAQYGEDGARRLQEDMNRELANINPDEIAGSMAQPSAQAPAGAPAQAAPTQAPTGAPSLEQAVIKAESGGNQGAVSPKGATGTMQLMPKTAAGLGVNPTDKMENIAGGVKYLTDLRAKYKDDKIALAAYNWGPANVDKWLQEGGDFNKLPKETQDYVNKITKLTGGEIPLTSGAAQEPTTTIKAPAVSVAATQPAPIISSGQIESSKATGKAQGEAAAALPELKNTATDMLRLVNTIEEHPGKEWAVGKSSWLTRFAPDATDVGGFRTMLEQLDAQAFLKSYQQLKGGGAITEVEGQKATKAFNRLKVSTSEAEFQTALNDLRQMIEEGVRVGYQKAGKAVPEGLIEDINKGATPAKRATGFKEKKQPDALKGFGSPRRAEQK